MTASRDELARTAEALTGSVTELHDAVHRLNRRTARHKVAITLAIIGVLLDIALSVAVVVVLHSQQAVNDQIRAQQQQLAATQEQAEATRARVLCPLYQVFLASADPQRRAALPEDKRPAYDHAVQVIREGAEVLACQAGP